MKSIQQDGKTVFVFSSEAERDEYFEQAHREADQEYKQELADLLRGYQIGTQKAREAYGRVRAYLETQRRESLIESTHESA